MRNRSRSVIRPYCSRLQDKKKKEEERGKILVPEPFSDSVTNFPKQRPHHPSRTSSEGATSPEDQEIGLAEMILSEKRLCDKGFAG